MVGSVEELVVTGLRAPVALVVELKGRVAHDRIVDLRGDGRVHIDLRAADAHARGVSGQGHAERQDGDREDRDEHREDTSLSIASML